MTPKKLILIKLKKNSWTLAIWEIIDIQMTIVHYTCL